jgi:hypothetical protein
MLQSVLAVLRARVGRPGRAGAVTGRLALALLLVAAPAAGATPEQLAAKQLAAGEKAARATFRAALAAAQIQIRAAIANVERSLPTAATPAAPGDAIFTALVSFQDTIFAARSEAAAAQAEAAQEALASLGVELHGIYPEAFYPGDGTARASFAAALAKDADRAYAKTRKRLAALAERFEAAGFALTFHLRPPLAVDSRLWNETIVNSNPSLPPTIDLALSFGDLVALGDAQIRLAGTGSDFPPEIGAVAVVALGQPDSAVVVNDSALPEDGRWRSSFSEQPFREAVYILGAMQATVPGDDVSLGVR